MIYGKKVLPIHIRYQVIKSVLEDIYKRNDNSYLWLHVSGSADAEKQTCNYDIHLVHDQKFTHYVSLVFSVNGFIQEIKGQIFRFQMDEIESKIFTKFEKQRLHML